MSRGQRRRQIKSCRILYCPGGFLGGRLELPKANAEPKALRTIRITWNNLVSQLALSQPKSSRRPESMLSRISCYNDLSHRVRDSCRAICPPVVRTVSFRAHSVNRFGKEKKLHVLLIVLFYLSGPLAVFSSGIATSLSQVDLPTESSSVTETAVSSLPEKSMFSIGGSWVSNTQVTFVMGE